MADRYMITYAMDPKRERFESMQATSEQEAFIMVRNIEEYFGGMTIACEKELPPTKRKKRINSDKRKKR